MKKHLVINIHGKGRNWNQNGEVLDSGHRKMTLEISCKLCVFNEMGGNKWLRWLG